jgi:hypothetical protein
MPSTRTRCCVAHRQHSPWNAQGAVRVDERVEGAAPWGDFLRASPRAVCTRAFASSGPQTATLTGFRDLAARNPLVACPRYGYHVAILEAA